jgi:sulfide:quinone oxidoreductase
MQGEDRHVHHVRGDAEMAYDYLHVIPPQRAPEFVRQSGLSWADRWVDQGWVECDPATLRHNRYEYLCRRRHCRRAEGQDGGEREMAGAGGRRSSGCRDRREDGTETYNGYTSCPLITRVGRAMLIEFDYNKPGPSFPGVIAPLEELWISWLMKEVALKATYNAMLRGRA